MPIVPEGSAGAVCGQERQGSYYCSLDELTSYERVVQLDVARAFHGGNALLCQHQGACAPRVSRSVKSLTSPAEHQPTAWPVPYACAQPYHLGSGSCP